MSTYISKYNAEGYYDSTAYLALKSIQKEEKKKSRIYRPLVFICSKFAGDVERNVYNARRYSKFAVDNNVIPIAPHLLFPQFMDDNNPAQRELGIFFGLVLMNKCEAVWVFGSTPSNGMSIEIAKAKKRNLPIRYFNELCQEINNNK